MQIDECALWCNVNYSQLVELLKQCSVSHTNTFDYHWSVCLLDYKLPRNRVIVICATDNFELRFSLQLLYCFCCYLCWWCFACFQTLNESNHISISSNPFHLEFINQLIAMKNWLIRLVYSESFECDLRFWFHCSMRWICISAENYSRCRLVVDYFGAKTNRMFDVIVESL